MTIPTWIALFASLGLGGIAAALIAAFIAREIKIAELRQVWINGLREDIAEYLGRLVEWDALQTLVRERMRRSQARDALSYADPTQEDDAALREIELRAETTLRRVMLRMNIEEDLHVELVGVLQALRWPNIDDRGGTGEAAAFAVEVAQRVLKREWQVTKWSFAADWVAGLKEWRRRVRSAQEQAGRASGYLKPTQRT